MSNPIGGAPFTVLCMVAVFACGYDWDSFDPRLGSNAASGGMAASNTASGTGGGNSGGAAGNGSGAAGGAPPPQLVSDGLLARYFLAEAASGTAPTEALDAAASPLALPILQDPVMAFVAEDGHRGLHWDIAGAPGGPRLLVAGTKILDLNGVTSATIESVARIDEAISSGSRLVHVGVDSSWHFSLGVESASLVDVPIQIAFALNTADGPFGTYHTTDFTVGRMVVHAVFDSTRVVPEERMRVFVNGIAAPVIEPGNYPPRGAALSLAGTEAIALGNRLINGRSIHGTLFYGAYYLTALDDAAIAQNTSVLLTNDDGP